MSGNLRAIILAALTSSLAWAQFGGGGAQRSTPAVQLPQSGRQSPGTVSTQQQAGPSPGANVVNSSIQIGGGFQGSVQDDKIPAGAFTLTLADAVKLGLTANLGVLTSDDTARASRAQRLRALSDLLPYVSIDATETSTQINLAAFGFKFNIPPGVGFSIPTVVGPFQYSQLLGNVSQSVYDPVSRRNWHAAQESERASTLSARDAREVVVLAVAGAYLETIATEARVGSQRAQVDNAQAVYHQAEVRKEAGTNARIDVTRTLVELQGQQQRLNALQSDLRKQKLALARLIGVPLDRELTLSDPLAFNPAPVPEAAGVVQQAFQKRWDLKAAESQVHAAEIVVSAAHAERLPSASLTADYGVLGPSPVSNHGVYSVTGAVNVPVFQGGRVKADIEMAEATLHQRQAELADQRGRVEQEVRTALIELETAIGEVRLAENNRGFANETLRESRDRFNAGVATTVEVVQAQEQVASAESDYISGLFAFDLARISLSRAMGQAETDLPGLLVGGVPAVNPSVNPAVNPPVNPPVNPGVQK
ncbi:MAG TPA: TolC family protein [Bryobacteraceae bacterium]|nr:TolC family protein [Bryobacteraceae bacterium]